MKLSRILEINNILKSIIDNTQIKIDALLKFRMLGIMKQLEPSVVNFETVRNEKIREYGKEEDGTIAIPQDDEAALGRFTKDMEELLESEVKIKLSQLKPQEIFDRGIPAEFLVELYDIIAK